MGKTRRNVSLDKREPRRAPVLDDWKTEAATEMAEEEMQEVFIIENEWSISYGDSGHENVSVHLTLEDAEDALYLKADALDVEIAEGEHSFNRYDSDDDDSDIYYIGSYVVGVNA